MTERKIPELKKPKPDAKDQRWVVYWNVWNSKKGKYVRKRNYTLNAFAEKRRHFEFLNLKRKLQKLQEEAESGTSSAVEVDDGSPTLYKLIEIVLERKSALRESARLSLDKYARVLVFWLKNQGFCGSPSKFNETTVFRFMNYLTSVRKVNNRTRNNYRSGLTTIFNVIAKMKNVKALKENPFLVLEKLPQDTGRNIAYTKEQTRELIQFMKARHEPLLLFCQFMYYTLARTHELSRLQVKHIGMTRPDQIYLPAEWSKNRRARYITIPPQLAALIGDSGILSKPKEWYIFGRGLLPSEEYYPSEYIAQMYRYHVLDKLGYPLEYTLYSWKHTGVTHNYLENVEPSALRIQMGYETQSSFDVYLKSLGLFENIQVAKHYVTLCGT